MKDKSINIFNSIFSIFILFSIIGGGLVFLLFMLAILIGGETGAFLSTTASNTIMPYFIKAAAMGMLVGLIILYTSGEHYLHLKDN